MDTSVFMPDENETLTIKRKAKAIWYCQQCPVVEDCLRYAYENNIQHGIYGGMTTKERRKNRYKWKRENGIYNNA